MLTPIRDEVIAAVSAETKLVGGGNARGPPSVSGDAGGASRRPQIQTFGAARVNVARGRDFEGGRVFVVRLTEMVNCAG